MDGWAGVDVPDMRREEGFTLIEILVVMLILALLAAVAIPSFFSQKDKATDAEAKAAVRVAQTSAETLRTVNEGAYDGPGGITVPNLVATEPTLTGAALTVPLVSEDTYTVRVQSATGNTFDIRRNNDGTVDMSCASAGHGGCPSDGNWGR
jgi:prepilin-type N-terminal cleavage/methylation domain-containing protein